jgi:hypothetical protein
VQGSGSADRISRSKAEAAAMSWSRRFDEPIILPNGQKLIPLKDATNLIQVSIALDLFQARVIFPELVGLDR